jgi:hypothetical protein
MELNELNLGQLMKINAYLNAGVDMQVKRILISEVMSGQSKDELLDPEGDQDVTNEQVNAWCVEHHDALFDIHEPEDGGAKQYTLKLNLTRCPYPALELEQELVPTWNKTLYACADGWSNMTIYELSYVWAAMDAFQETGNAAQLHRALAIVYRPSRVQTDAELAAGWNGDRRRSLYKEESSIEVRAKAFAGVHYQALSLLWLWLTSCRAQIVARYPVIFEGKKVQPNVDEPDFGWAGLMLAVADGPVNLEVVANHRYSTIFLHLAKLEADRLEAQRKRAQRVRQ